MTVTINGTTGIVAPAFDGAVDAADLTGTVPSSSVPYVSGRNRIINGDMRIDQRNSGASVTPADNAYTLDRWKAKLSQSAKYSVQQSSVAPAGFTKSLLVTSLSSYSITSSDRFGLQHAVEGLNAGDFAFGSASASSITLSFWVRSSLTGTFGAAFFNNNANRSYPFTYAISSANTWEQKTVTIAGDTSGTWATDNTVGIYIEFSLGTGSTLSGTAGAWAGAFTPSATGATSIVGTNGATFYITGVQLEAGSIATPFERRPYGTELALCQRYYERITETNTIETIIGIGMAYSSTRVLSRLDFLVEKRVNPTVSVSGVSHVQPLIANGSHVSPTGVSFLTNTRGCRMDMTGLSGLAVAACAEVRFNPDATNPNISIDAEL
jgi:hypothetical protein